LAGLRLAAVVELGTLPHRTVNRITREDQNMTPTAPPSPVRTTAQAPIPGISAAELDAMEAAAARFLVTCNAGPATATAVAADIQALTEPAGPLAAGITSALRGEYGKVRDTHFMMMLPPAR
jgi:hypothetical protein